MKKALNILITFLFLLSFVGVQINKHYMNGKLYKVSFFSLANDSNTVPSTCPTCSSCTHMCKPGMKKKCSFSNEKEILRLNNVFTKKQYIIPSTSLISLFSTPKSVENIFLKFLTPDTHTYYLFPPPLSLPNAQSFLDIFKC